MSMTTRKCLSIASWGASLVFCGLLLFSAYAAAAHGAKTQESPVLVRDVIPTIQAYPTHP